MGTEHRFRSDRGVDAEDAFDWVTPAEELQIPLDQARALYEEALRRAAYPGSRPAKDLYLEWLAEWDPAEPLVEPGRRALTMRVGQRQRGADVGRGRVPGKRPLTVYLAGAHAAPDARDDARAPLELREARSSRAAVARGLEIFLGGGAAAAGRDAARPDWAWTLLEGGASGSPVPYDVATRLGPHVGADAVSAARLHTGDLADRVAAAHRARAVAVGESIFFARGEYTPGTRRGDELLAHELTHVAQARRGSLARAAAKGLDSGDTLDPAEAEADLRAKLAVIELHEPKEAAPPLAAPTAQPTSAGERAAQLAAQQRRLALAGQAAPNAPVKEPPRSRPQAPVAHPSPKLKPAAAAAPAAKPGAAGNAYVQTFEASPSKQALDLWAKAGPEATTQAAADQARFDAALEPLPIVLDGREAPAAKPGGPAAAPARPPAAGAKPPAAKPKPTPAVPPVTAGAVAAQKVKPNTSKEQQQAAAKQAIAALPTTSPAINPNPGPAPVTDLAGQSDPARALGEHQHALGEGAKALEAEKKKVLAGPGAAQVQPVVLDEKVTVPKPGAGGPMPALPTVEGMTKLKKWGLPADVQASFDEVAKPKMEASLAQAKAKVTEAETKRDADRAKAVDDAHEKVKQAHTDADKQQQTKVAQARTDIANHQADTLLKQEKEVKKLEQQSGEKKKGAVSKIQARVQADQSKVEGDYQGAQKQADEKKRQGEQEVARKKEEAKRKAEGDHDWWDDIGDAIGDAIKSIADEIDKALDDLGKAIGQLLDTVKNAACQLIDAARDFVCQALTEFGDWLKSAVTTLLGSVFPELAAALNRLIDSAVNVAKAAVNAIADKLKSAVTALCDGLKAAVESAIAACRAAVQVAATLAQALVTGDWSAAAKMVLDGILRILGIDPAAFHALIAKVESSLDKIIEDPGAFVGHLVDAVKLGFRQFGQHFWTHLQNGLVQWLFGTFAQAGIRMPARFDVAGIFDLVTQILGLTWPRLRTKVVREIGERNTERLEFVAQYLEALITGGFAGLWEKVQQDLSNLWDMVVGGIKDWLIQSVVQQAIMKIAMMWNPVGAIVELIRTAWNLYQWVKENAQRIFGLVQAVVDSVANIAAGNISGAANWIEQSLAKLVPIAISLFADLLGLGGLADHIRGIIERVQGMVDRAIDKLIERVKALFKGKDKQGAQQSGSEQQEIGETINFEAAQHSHRLWIEVRGETSTVMVASTPTPVSQQLTQMSAQVSALPPDKQQAANNLLTQATTALQRTSTEASKAATSQESSNNNQVKEQEHSLADTLKGLFEIFSLNDGPILERPLQMNGHDHTLYVSIQGGKPLVELASRRQDLLLLVWRARDQEKAGAKRGPLLQELAWAETKLKELLEFERAGAYSTRSLEDIKSDTETLANYLIDIGATFGIQDLENLGHPSKYVEGNILKEEYRSIVREKFYSSSYRTSTLEWKAKRLRTLLHPTDQAQFKDELTGTWEPRTIENTPDDNVTIDHIHKVVDHWNSGGNNMSQSERLDFYNDTSNLQLTTRAHNSTDGALARAQGSRYSSRVGDQFRGPIDDE